MAWHEEYQRKLVSAEEAVKVVKSGDRVVISNLWEPQSLAIALSQRKDELKNVEIYSSSFSTELAWFQPHSEESFTVCLEVPLDLFGLTTERGRFDHFTPLSVFRFKAEDEGRQGEKGIDVFMVVVSPPDKDGFCSFGHVLLSKKDIAKRAKRVLAEVKDVPQINLRTHGDNFLHVSQIDYFVEYAAATAPWRLQRGEPGESTKWIAEYVSSLVQDGDTIELGIGRSTESIAMLGAFDNRHDLGLHSGMTFPGCMRLIKSGVLTGKCKNINPNKMVTSWLYENSDEDLAFVDGNPMFEMQGLEYMHDIKLIAAHDNFVAINGVLAIDLNGQMTSESLGSRLMSVAGGLPPFAMGAMLSKGGRNIIVLHSTAAEGTISRIAPSLEQGTIVTIPWTFADLVVSEYGIARLLGKSQRQRADELIAIAHPDFRGELRREAQKLFYPSS